LRARHIGKVAKQEFQMKDTNSKTYLFTSESVSEGHPDKIADQISDAILDAFLMLDPDARVACETVLANQFVLVAGEFRTENPSVVEAVQRDTERLVRQTLRGLATPALKTASIRISVKFELPSTTSRHTLIRVSIARTEKWVPEIRDSCSVMPVTKRPN
jgi:hypothetical protein